MRIAVSIIAIKSRFHCSGNNNKPNEIAAKALVHFAIRYTDLLHNNSQPLISVLSPQKMLRIFPFFFLTFHARNIFSTRKFFHNWMARASEKILTLHLDYLRFFFEGLSRKFWEYFIWLLRFPSGTLISSILRRFLSFFSFLFFSLSLLESLAGWWWHLNDLWPFTMETINQIEMKRFDAGKWKGAKERESFKSDR